MPTEGGPFQHQDVPDNAGRPNLNHIFGVKDNATPALQGVMAEIRKIQAYVSARSMTGISDNLAANLRLLIIQRHEYSLTTSDERDDAIEMCNQKIMQLLGIPC